MLSFFLIDTVIKLLHKMTLATIICRWVRAWVWRAQKHLGKGMGGGGRGALISPHDVSTTE